MGDRSFGSALAMAFFTTSPVRRALPRAEAAGCLMAGKAGERFLDLQDLPFLNHLLYSNILAKSSSLDTPRFIY